MLLSGEAGLADAGNDANKLHDVSKTVLVPQDVDGRAGGVALRISESKS